MKLYQLLIVLFACTAFASCKNEGIKPDTQVKTVNTQLLTGKWSLVKDSITHGAVKIVTDEYIAKANDYYDFRADGKCYIKEGNSYDTLSYKMVTDTTVLFGEAFVPSLISPFTAHSAKITYGYPQPPGGVYAKTVFLKK